MTVAFQNPQTVQYPQYSAQNVQPQNPQSQQAQNTQYQCACTAYANNPYLCAYAPTSYLVIPQGQITTPTMLPQQPIVQATQQSPTTQSVNYNQITPYINGNSEVFQPSIQTQSGHAIATATTVSQPLTAQEAQIVYQGPVRSVNPQITPIEQTDNEINKQYNDYFVKKAEANKELKKALNNSTGLSDKESSFLSKAAKVLGLALIICGIYKYRTKIPIIKKLFI